jgi:hypothetical protein
MFSSLSESAFQQFASVNIMGANPRRGKCRRWFTRAAAAANALPTEAAIFETGFHPETFRTQGVAVIPCTVNELQPPEFWFEPCIVPRGLLASRGAAKCRKHLF